MPVHWLFLVHAVVPSGQNDKLLQVPGVVGHCDAEPHAAPPNAQLPPVTAGQVAALVQDFSVHAPLRGQFALLEHTVTESGQVFWLQDPLIVVHAASDRQTFPGGLLQTPQSMFARQRFPLLLQLPLNGQFASLVQAVLVDLLQVPLRTAQSLTDAQRLPTLLQWPTLTQSDCCMQLLALTLQAPGCGVQSAFCVQLLLVWIEQVPGLGVHIGGSHTETGVHVTSGSGLVSQPAGLYVVVQTGGRQVWVFGRLHVCDRGPLQV